MKKIVKQVYIFKNIVFNINRMSIVKSILFYYVTYEFLNIKMGIKINDILIFESL